MEIVNCKEEKRLFQELLKCNTDKRILSIQSPPETGKSTLLDYLESHCQTAKKNKNKIPVARVDLKQTNVTTPLALVKQIAGKLQDCRVVFTMFQNAYDYYLRKDFKGVMSVKNRISSFYLSPPLANRNSQSKSLYQFQGASFDNSEQFEFIDNQLNLYVKQNIDDSSLREIIKLSTQSRDWTEEQDENAQNICIQAFFYDLNEYFTRKRKGKRKEKYVNKQPLVLLFDTYENIGDTPLCQNRDAVAESTQDRL